MRSDNRGFFAVALAAGLQAAGCRESDEDPAGPPVDAGSGGSSVTAVQGPPTPDPPGVTHRGRVIELLPFTADATDPFSIGPGLPGVEVCAHEMESVPCTLTDEDGQYVLRGLPINSEIALTFHRDGYFPMARPLVTLDASVHLLADARSGVTAGPPAYSSSPIPMLQEASICPDGACSYLAVHGSATAPLPDKGSVVVLVGARPGIVVTAGSIAATYTGPAPSYAEDAALTGTESGGRALLPNIEPGIATIRVDGQAGYACGSWRGGSVNALPSDPGQIRVPVLPGHVTLAAPSCSPKPQVCSGVTCKDNTINLPTCCTTEAAGKPLMCEGCGVTVGVCGVHLTFLPAVADQCFQVERPGELDETCPGYETQFGFREGCCTDEGFCGGSEPVIPLGCAYADDGTGRVIRGAPCGANPGFTCGDQSCPTKTFDTPPCCTAEGTGVAGDALELVGLEAGRCGTLVDGVCLQTLLLGRQNEACPSQDAGGSSLPGCCTDEGYCGSVDPGGRGCVYLPSAGKGAPCTNE
jgi:hypothetical protein